MLMIGLVAINAAMLLVRYIVGGISNMPPETTTILTYVFAACAVIIPSVALIVFKPRVPIRRPDQSVSQYWSEPAVATNVTTLWFLVEGSGTLAAVGYFLTGSPILVIAAGLTTGLFWTYGPDRFANG
jgi:hypothetical protein